MNTSFQIFIDKTIVRALIVPLNLLVGLVGKILRLDHSLDKPFKTIAICKYKGLGSIIQATPLLQTLRKNYPDAKIIFISSLANAAVLKKINCIDEIIVLDDSGIVKILKSFPGFILRILNARIGLYIDLEIYSNFSSLITTISASRNRIGFYLRSSNYRMGIYTHMMYYNTRVPIFQTYLQMARLLNCKDVIEDLLPLESQVQSIKIKDKEADLIKMKYFVVNPNASDLRLERRWGQENFALLIDRLSEKFPEHDFILTGSKSEKSYTEETERKISAANKVINTAGKTSFDELLAIIKHADLVITNDTGPMHISFSLNKKTVALFGPCSPEQYGRSHNTISLYKKIYCSPCVHEFQIPPCKGDNRCMKLIEIREVEKAVEKLMSKDYNNENTENPKFLYALDLPEVNAPLGLVKRI
jgi:ADP-heptose:LPS heptosyltransferase